MSDESLIQALPDLVAFVRPDGLITDHLGGQQVAFLRGSGSLAGRQLADALQPDVAALVARLARRAFASRANCEAEFVVDGATYLARLSAQGPGRALCVIRHVAAAAARDDSAPSDASSEGAGRRGFVRRFQASVADAALRERPLAVCMIFLDGLADIGRLIDFSIGERILTEVLRRVPASEEDPDGTSWYLGQLGEGLLGLVINGSVDRDRIRAIAGGVCEGLAQPVRINEAAFFLTPSAGVACLGEDAAQPAALLNHARAAMLESKRTGGASIQFYSDTLRMLPVARLDIERELRKAIAEGQIGLRYAARHDLATGRIAGIQATMRWDHPLRGEIPPAQFLPIADATGLAVSLSRAALERLVRELAETRQRFGADLPVSFGALRQHVSSGKLLRDCQRLLPSGELRKGRLELRIAERTLATLNRPEHVLAEIVESGARIVIDELGRDFSSFTRLPQLPLWGLQMERALVVAAVGTAAALRSCRAIAAFALALEIAPIASGVDDEDTRACMASIGCRFGLGDRYPVPVPAEATAPAARAAG